jgi:hypothetical protein
MRCLMKLMAIAALTGLVVSPALAGPYTKEEAFSQLSAEAQECSTYVEEHDHLSPLIGHGQAS